MYRILIVDDDKLIVDDLISLLDWKALDCAVPDSAADGRQALELLQKKTYDIVLTDISMPIMDGVELIRRAKEQNSPAVFLVISNYDDFVLVKEAMKHGAAEYLLKYEITAQSLAQQIRYAQELHRKHRPGSTSGDELLEQQKRAIRKLYRQEPGEFRIGLPVHSGVWVPVTLVLFEQGDDERYKQITWLSEQALEASECVMSMLSSVDSNKLVLLLSVENPSYLLSIRIIMNYLQIFLRLAKEENIAIAAAVGRFCHEEPELCAYLYRLKDQEQNFFYMKPYAVLQNQPNKAASETAFDLLAWSDRCRNELPEEAVSSLMAYFQSNRTPKDQVKGNCARLAAATVSPQSLENSAVAHIWAANTAWEISKILTGILKEQSLAAVNMQSGVRMEIRRVLDYIADNYGRTISLSELADTACLSPNYFCRIFKSETGLNYTEYLSRYRLEQAKKLLCSTTLRTHEIAEQVGFRDYRYFCRLFKEATGLTCSEFRREYGEKK